MLSAVHGALLALAGQQCSAPCKLSQELIACLHLPCGRLRGTGVQEGLRAVRQHHDALNSMLAGAAAGAVMVQLAQGESIVHAAYSCRMPHQASAYAEVEAACIAPALAQPSQPAQRPHQ